MNHHAFPSPCPYLDMKEKRDAYMKHIKALRTPRHIIDNTQPETPSRLITRKNRYIEMQRKIMRTGDENIKLISNCNQRDVKNIISPTRSPSSKSTGPKGTPRSNNTKNGNNQQKKKQPVLVNEDWISNVATELASLPSTSFMNRKSKMEEKKKEDLPPVASNTETKLEENSPMKKDEKSFYTTENTTLGEAGYKARLESMVNEINGLAD